MRRPFAPRSPRRGERFTLVAIVLGLILGQAPVRPAALAAASGPTILVQTKQVRYPASSLILGAVRNHTADSIVNADAKLAAMRALTPTWGQRQYLYRVGHGPTDGRLDYSDMTGYHFEQEWDQPGPYPYDDVRNALREANTLGAAQIHVVNFGTGSPQEAGRYVSYLNKSSDPNRAAHPLPQQDVGLFEIGNEVSWSMVRGHDQYAPNEIAYAQRAKLFAEQMRANSDVPIQIGVVAGTNSNWYGNGWSGGAATVKNILTTMGPDVDFLIFHGYPSWPVATGDPLTIMAQNEWNRQKLETEIKPAIKQYAGGRDIWLANTEFFSGNYGDPTAARGMLGAMYSADSLILAMNEDIRVAAQFSFDHEGDIADNQFFFHDDPAQPTAIFQFQRLLAQHWGDNIVATTGQGIPTLQVSGADPSGNVTLPELAFSAATTGNTTFVMVLNRTNGTDIAGAIHLDVAPTKVVAYQLTGPSGWASATGAVTTIANPSLTAFTFPRASVTIFQVTTGGAPIPVASATSTPTATATAAPTTIPTPPATAVPVIPTTAAPIPTPSNTPTPGGASGGTDLAIYDNALRGGWQDQSWGGAFDFAQTGTVEAGSAAIAVTYSIAQGVLVLHNDSLVPTGGYRALRLAVNGGAAGGQRLTIRLADWFGHDGPALDLARYLPGGAVAAGQWQVATIPLADLGFSGNGFNRLELANASGAAQPTFYLDDLLLR